MTDTTVVAEGLYFGEGPRWHAGGCGSATSTIMR